MRNNLSQEMECGFSYQTVKIMLYVLKKNEFLLFTTQPLKKFGRKSPKFPSSGIQTLKFQLKIRENIDSSEFHVLERKEALLNFDMY